MFQLRIYINQGENISNTFDAIANLLKNDKDLLVNENLVDININLKFTDKRLEKINESIIIFKNGKLLDCRKELINVTVRKCFNKAKEVLQEKLLIIPNTYEEEIKEINDKINECNGKLKKTSSDNVRKKLQRAVNRKKIELTQTIAKKEKEQKLCNFYKNIEKCFSDGKITYNAIVASDKDTNVILDVYVRIKIDEECSVFSSPVYFIKDFSEENIEDYLKWYSLKENTDIIDMLSFI